MSSTMRSARSEMLAAAAAATARREVRFQRFKIL
jgi:hypothetical protein